MRTPPLALLLLLVVVLAPLPATAGAPTDQIRTHIDRMIAILDDRSLGAADRDAAARRLVETTFDLLEAARHALGPRVATLPARDRQELIELVKTFFGDACMVMLAAYTERPARMREHIRYVGETITGDQATVRLTMEPGAEVLPVEARLLRRGPRWLIHDIAVGGVSVIENYRAQFEQLARR